MQFRSDETHSSMKAFSHILRNSKPWTDARSGRIVTDALIYIHIHARIVCCIQHFNMHRLKCSECMWMQFARNVSCALNVSALSCV